MRPLLSLIRVLPALLIAALAARVQASGPVERMVQVLVQSDDARHVVVRWGLASEGFLISRDGGTTFTAMCSQAITPTADARDKLRSISGQKVPSAAATLIDASGKLLVGQLNGLWSDDGNGCAWSKQLDPAWVNGLRLDASGNVLALVTTRAGEGEATTAKAELRRRDAAGAWTTLGALRAEQPLQRVYGADLIAGPTRLYASAAVAVGALDVRETFRVFASDDAGVSWREVSELPASQQDGFTLLAVDPRDAQRVLAVTYRDGATDTLLLSEDGGVTFRTYGDIRETSGVVFAPDGRLFVGDAGDASSNDATGGLWTAPRTGEPLKLVAGTQFVDCLGWDADANTLRSCKRDRYGTLDPTSGVFTERARLDQVAAQVSCPGTDVVAACSAQLNAGPSWCCAGHYPFTPFCSAYDVTIDGSQRVFCGLAGQAYDRNAGRLPVGYDAGPVTPQPAVTMPDAGALAARSSKDGCALASSSRAGWLALVLVVLMRRSWRRRDRVSS
ncbi:MAG: hypothetical protein ABW352_15590 [Polyangiales bacterium]